jgi:beta-glucanase (GH16 family)
MRYLTLLILISVSLFTVGQTPSTDPHWQLVWEDDFNSFDSNKWLKVDWAKHGNSEPQLYLANNISVTAGVLNIEANDNATLCPPGAITVWGACEPCDHGKMYPYTSGWIETQQNFSVEYGYIESKIKLPYGYGFWPAFWTYKRANYNATNATEIDIFEMLGSKPPNIIGTNLHMDYCQTCSNQTPCTCKHLYDKMCPWENSSILCYGRDLEMKNYSYTDWHVYGLEWSPSKIIWYIDDKVVRIMPNPGIVDQGRIILNLAIEPWAMPNSSTPFPSNMQVDYLRVFELSNECNLPLNLCNYNFSNYNNKVKKEIIIGSSNCSNSINSNQNIHLRAKEGILINGEFDVPLGAELYLDVNPCY